MDSQRLFPQKPENVQESLVYEHPQDVSVADNQRLVERLQIVLPSGDVQTLDIPGDLGESFDDQRFTRRRRERLEALARSWNEDACRHEGQEDPGPLPAILSRTYALWTYRHGGGR